MLLAMLLELVAGFLAEVLPLLLEVFGWCLDLIDIVVKSIRACRRSDHH